jgi:hypothetical protein
LNDAPLSVGLKKIQEEVCDDAIEWLSCYRPMAKIRLNEFQGGALLHVPDSAAQERQHLCAQIDDRNRAADFVLQASAEEPAVTFSDQQQSVTENEGIEKRVSRIVELLAECQSLQRRINRRDDVEGAENRTHSFLAYAPVALPLKKIGGIV